MTHHRQTITADGAPAAVGPYSHAVRSGNLLFCSGQIPLDPVTGEIVSGGAVEQAARCLENLVAVAAAVDAQLSDAVRVTIYVTDMNEFAAINEVYAGFFETDPPARVTIGVAALPKGAQVEMDAIIAIPEG